MNEEPIPSVTTAVASSLSTKINRQLTIENGIVVHYAFNGPGGYAAYTWKPMAEFGQFVFTLHNGNVVQEMRYFIDPPDAETIAAFIVRNWEGAMLREPETKKRVPIRKHPCGDPDCNICYSNG